MQALQAFLGSVDLWRQPLARDNWTEGRDVRFRRPVSLPRGLEQWGTGTQEGGIQHPRGAERRAETGVW